MDERQVQTTNYQTQTAERPKKNNSLMFHCTIMEKNK